MLYKVLSTILKYSMHMSILNIDITTIICTSFPPLSLSHTGCLFVILCNEACISFLRSYIFTALVQGFKSLIYYLLAFIKREFFLWLTLWSLTTETRVNEKCLTKHYFLGGKGKYINSWSYMLLKLSSNCINNFMLIRNNYRIDLE